MSIICGVEFNDNLCRGCLKTGGGKEFFALGINMRFFTDYLNIDINPLDKSHLCVNCQKLISKILNYGDRVLKANTVLMELTKTMDIRILSEAAINSKRESRKILGAMSLSADTQISMESATFVKDEFSEMKSDTNFNMLNFQDNSSFVKNEELCVTEDVDRLAVNQNNIQIKDTTDDIEIDGTELSNGTDDDDRRSSDKRRLKSTTVTIEKRNKVNTKSRGVTNTRGHSANLKKDSNMSDKITIINLSKDEVSEEFARLANENNKTTLFYRCNLCHKGLSSQELYEEHMVLHSEKSGDYECDICHKRFRTERRLFAHAYQHTKRYRCNACGLQCRARDSVVGHIKTVHDNVGGVTCDICASTFKNPYALQRHTLYAHRNKPRLECQQCHRSFGNKNTLRYHRKLKHAHNLPENERRFVCATCGEKFFGLHNLKSHMSRHTETRDFYCIECDFSFKSEKSLNAHLRDTLRHADPEKVIMCQMCPRVFADRKYLNRHIADGHRAESHKCELCSKMYSSRQVLRKHTRVAHEGHREARRFVCDVCGATFMRRNTLLNHMNIHLGTRPYKCDVCSADFPHSGSLYTHRRLKHKLGSKREKNVHFRKPSDAINAK